MTIKEMKDWIDKASYEELLGKWRRGSIGDPLFIGEVGNYYVKRMREKYNEVGIEGHIKASKNIGWEK